MSEAKVGMRVRLKVGQAVGVSQGADPERVKEKSPFMDWVAGRIPVGTVGTLYKPPGLSKSSYALLSIHWDNIQPKKAGGEFGAGLQEGQPLHYWLEEVEAAANGHDTIGTVENEQRP